jgi:hypothetical protein
MNMNMLWIYGGFIMANYVLVHGRLSNNSKSKEKERQIERQIQKEGKFLPSKAIVRQPLYL